MSEQSSGTSTPGFFKRLGIAAAQLLIPIHTSLIVGYFALHTVSGSDLGFIDVLGFILPWLFIPSVVLLPLALWHRSGIIMVLASIPVALFSLIYGQLYLPGLPTTTTDSIFTVMTHNVFIGNSHADQIVAAIETYNPDIVAFQEINQVVSEYLEVQLSTEYSYHRIEQGQGIFSRYPIEDYISFNMDGEMPRLVQQCVLNIEGHQATFINVHPSAPPVKSIRPYGLPLTIPLGTHSKNRDAGLNSLLSRLEEIKGPLIVMGDFNLTDQQNHYSDLTRSLRDAYRQSGWGMGFTFARYPRSGIALWRIDYVFHSPDLTALHTTVGDFGGSDHRPVIAKLGFLETK